MMKLSSYFGASSVVGAAIVLAQAAFAGDGFQPKGYIQNDRGDQCWYTQITDPESTYFHGTLKGKMGVITFDDPGCMSAADVGLDVNKMMINNIIARWYSHSDAAFQTRVSELFPGSMMQKKGLCIQSSTYPLIGITVDYEIRNKSIIRVRHGSSVQGCTK
ncbi:hypothetical protein [Wenzhouxiangella sp. EGI_FJ10305]|uniref:hypothetical protein n=1 Tax=Wenzhouxiangella sp. EGI_FJ10305 TaxID=3243768 RepID=UPI0035DEE5C6